MTNNKQQIVEKVLDISKNISDYLNQDALVEFVKLHGIDPKRSFLHLKQEVVADVGLFFSTKKRYVLNIVNREGRDVSEYEIKGIAIRRSEYPSYTKECMAKLLDLILKEEKLSFNNIAEYCKETEKNMINFIREGSTRIARSVIYKDKSEYKVIPSHTLGADLWNNLEYEYFVPGTRGYQFKILSVNVLTAPDRVLDNINHIGEKNNNIVVPYEVDKLPEYYVINVKEMLNDCWIRRYKEILEPIYNQVEKFL